MSWTSASDLKAQLARFWGSGEWPRSIVTGATQFPRRLTLKGPSPTEITDQFQAVRAWITSIESIGRMRVEWRSLNHRLYGMQRLPAAVWFDTSEDAAAFVGKRGDIARLNELVALTRSAQPALIAWLAQRPLQAIEAANDWPRLLAIVDWISRHPRPGVYLRQLDIAGVHSKFIEAQRVILGELLDIVLPNEAVDPAHTGVGAFAARYGFTQRPVRIRFRVLDDRPKFLPLLRTPDIALDADNFARLSGAWRRVFITENETNFLAFPNVPDSIVLFGAGYGWSALARAQWLARCEIRYWGDIDTHGFAILHQLRGHFGHVESFLMDRATLMAHEPLWGEEASPARHDLPRLTANEQDLYDELRDNRIRPGLRLEQERVGYGWITSNLAKVTLA